MAGRASNTQRRHRPVPVLGGSHGCAQPEHDTLSGAQTNLVTYITTTLQSIATAPHIADINAIPNIAGNVAHIDVASNANTAYWLADGTG